MAKALMITIPKTTKWEEYEKELLASEQGAILNFKVSNFPKIPIGSKCYIVYNGFIIGYHIISGFSKKEFKCSTTGNIWDGKFVERTGKFQKILEVPMKGFQGFRYIEEEHILDMQIKISYENRLSNKPSGELFLK